MSSITPITLGADLVTYGRGVDTVYRATRPPEQPAIDPPAVILPRTAAWLNVPVASDLTGNLGSSDQPDTGQLSAPAPEAVAQPSLATSLNAQTAAANAASATANPPQGAEAPSAGIGSVVQLV